LTSSGLQLLASLIHGRPISWTDGDEFGPTTESYRGPGSIDLESQRATALEARHPEGGAIPTAFAHRPRTAPQPLLTAARCSASPAVGGLLFCSHTPVRTRPARS
jgi:hypothetical protein